MADPANYPVQIEVPAGPITLEGTRRNARMVIEYVEGWLNGRGAKGIDSLAGKPGIHPALMEDLATGRMSVAQIAQRIRHRARTTAGPEATHDFPLVKRLLHEERDDILRLAREAPATSGDAGLRGGGGALPQGGQDRPALDQELHRPRLPQPRLLHPPRPRPHRRRPRRVLRSGRRRRRSSTRAARGTLSHPA